MGIFDKLFGKKDNNTAIAEPITKEEPAQEVLNDMRDCVTWDILDIDASELDKHPDTLERIRRGEIDGLYIRNAVGSKIMDNPEEYLASLTKEDTGIDIQETPFGYVVGRTVNGCAFADLETIYFPETENVSKVVENVFQKEVEDIVESNLNKIASGRKVTSPKYTNGQYYKASTIRVLKTGRAEGMRVHIGNEFLQNLPQLEHMSKMVDKAVQLSYFIVVQKPEKGGELQVFDKVWKNTDKDLVVPGSIEKLVAEREKSFENVKSVKITPEVGDMFLFDGGRIWHKVTPVEGNTTRITIGGFVSFAKDGKHMYYYA